MGADFIQVRALELLDCMSDGLALARTGHAPPTRQYVSHGAPPVDICDDEIPGNGQLTVHVETQRGIHNRSIPDNPRVPKTLLIQPIVTYVIQLWRCWPTMEEDGAAPTGTALNVASDAMNRDAWCMLTQLYAEVSANTVFGGLNCGELTIGDMRPIGDPTGGTAGLELRVDLALNDLSAPAATP